tara:strand:- start:1039 stop:1251 length:213 start_codon:yes stop_codon:yes gene_type:complete
MNKSWNTGCQSFFPSFLDHAFDALHCASIKAAFALVLTRQIWVLWVGLASIGILQDHLISRCHSNREPDD